MARALLQLLSDFLSALLYAVVLATTGELWWAAGAATLAAVLQVAWNFARGRGSQLMQWASLALVVVLGCSSAWLSDPRFVMLKPSVAHVAIAVVMMRRGWMTQYVPERVRDAVGERGLERWGYRWAGFMILLGMINAGVALTGKLGLWSATLAALGLAKLALFGVQYASIRASVRRARVAAVGGV